MLEPLSVRALKTQLDVTVLVKAASRRSAASQTRDREVYMSGSKSTSHHHYCIAVPHLEEAVAYFTRTMHVEFGPARELTMKPVGQSS